MKLPEIYDPVTVALNHSDCDLRYPRGYQYYPQFRSILSAYGGDEAKAHLLFFRWWTDMGLQIEIHGRAGFMFSEQMDLLAASLPSGEDGKTPVQILIGARLLSKTEGGHYFSSFWRKVNLELDSDSLSERKVLDLAREHFQMQAKFASHASKTAAEIMASLPSELQIKSTDAKPFTEKELTRAVRLIRFADAICHEPDERKEWPPSILHTAWDVVSRFTDPKLTQSTKLLWINKDRLKSMTVNPELFLKYFDDAVKAATPEGVDDATVRLGFRKPVC